MIAIYFTSFRLGIRTFRTDKGYTRTYRLGWLNVAYFDRTAAMHALRAPKPSSGMMQWLADNGRL
jgi:hypothetical protein